MRFYVYDTSIDVTYKKIMNGKVCYKYNYRCIIKSLPEHENNVNKLHFLEFETVI